jgi:hypothetical protein
MTQQNNVSVEHMPTIQNELKFTAFWVVTACISGEFVAFLMDISRVFIPEE